MRIITFLAAMSLAACSAQKGAEDIADSNRSMSRIATCGDEVLQFNSLCLDIFQNKDLVQSEMFEYDRGTAFSKGLESILYSKVKLNEFPNYEGEDDRLRDNSDFNVRGYLLPSFPDVGLDCYSPNRRGSCTLSSNQVERDYVSTLLGREVTMDYRMKFGKIRTQAEKWATSGYLEYSCSWGCRDFEEAMSIELDDMSVSYLRDLQGNDHAISLEFEFDLETDPRALETEMQERFPLAEISSNSDALYMTLNGVGFSYIYPDTFAIINVDKALELKTDVSGVGDDITEDLERLIRGIPAEKKRQDAKMRGG